MLTESQVEAAAREYCRLRGEDPDRQVYHGADPDGRGIVPDVLLSSRLWERAARDIREFDLLRAAVAAAETTTI
jgi:hypothetical protein